MQKRFVTIWFPYLVTDWMAIKNPSLRKTPFAIVMRDHGRVMIREPARQAIHEGVVAGMMASDARIRIPDIRLVDELPGQPDRLLLSLCRWFIRYTPVVSADPPDGLILDVTGCVHLWGSEHQYMDNIRSRLQAAGYHVRMTLSDSIGASWAVTHFGTDQPVIESGGQTAAILSLPPEALRLPGSITSRLHQLGLHQVQHFIHISRGALRRRFGETLLHRLDQALGTQPEFREAMVIHEPYHEKLYCLEPIVTATGIEIALQRLLDQLCGRLQKEGLGIRTASLYGYRLDGKIVSIRIGTLHASNAPEHLFYLFHEKTGTLEPAGGIELFVLEATKTEKVHSVQESLLNSDYSLLDPRMAEFLERVTHKLGENILHRYLPDAHHWPERSIREARSLKENPLLEWPGNKLRPIHLLPVPHPIEVMAPVPDYPPIHFKYQGVIHYIKKADGPERIEREWWIEEGLHRDYYTVEDEAGNRYWLFRSGHYQEVKQCPWFLHGFFA